MRADAPPGPSPAPSAMDWAAIAAGAGVVVLAALCAAWVSEDAFITYRVIQNWIDGYGLRWNVDERVQVYTHPLWMLLNAAGYLFTREIPYTVTVIGLLCTLAAFAVVAHARRGDPYVLWIAFVAPFVLSRTLTTYATSGFETPLTYALLAGFGVQLASLSAGGPLPWGTLVLWASLGVLNRMDHVLLFGPPLAFLVALRRHDMPWSRLVLAALPLVGWLAFATLYYGSPIPNTALAKTHADVARMEALRQGVLYAADGLRFDLAIAPIVALGTAVAIHLARIFMADRTRVDAGALASLQLGAFLYGLYVVSIGGGFLSGRWWAPPLLASLLLVVLRGDALAAALRSMPSRRRAMIGAAGAAAILAAQGLAIALESVPTRGAIRARSGGRLELTGALEWEWSRAARLWRSSGMGHRQRAESRPSEPYVVEAGAVGILGVSAGPAVTLIDRYALTDAFLARLPLAEPGKWRPGHLQRPIPRGYLNARASAEPVEMDPHLAELYRLVRSVVAGPLLSADRLTAATTLASGRADDLVARWASQEQSAAETNTQPEER